MHLTLVKLSCMSVILYIHLIVKYAGMILNALMFTCFELKIRKFEMLVVYIVLNIVLNIVKWNGTKKTKLVPKV